MANLNKTYRPPAGVAKAARRARRWKEKYNVDAGTRTGWYRSAQLSKRKRITLETIRRMHSFFQRHSGNEKVPSEKKPWEDNGKVMHLAWGGDAGKAWAKRVLKEEGLI